MKKSGKYIKPELRVLGLESENGFLKGSVTDVKIQPSKVSVQEWNDGFREDGGFKDLTFD